MPYSFTSSDASSPTAARTPFSISARALSPPIRSTATLTIFFTFISFICVIHFKPSLEDKFLLHSGCDGNYGRISIHLLNHRFVADLITDLRCPREFYVGGLRQCQRLVNHRYTQRVRLSRKVMSAGDLILLEYMPVFHYEQRQCRIIQCYIDYFTDHFLQRKDPYPFCLFP